MTSATEIMTASARSQVYAVLAQAFAGPNAATLTWLKQALPTADAALATTGGTESCAALAAVRREIDDLDEDGLAAAHHRVFGHGVSGDCPPYEGEYGHAHIFQKTQNLADNAGFFQAFGLAPAPDLADRLDHISVELEFLHVLAAKEAYALARGHGEERLAIVRDATRKYLNDHLGRWAPAFAAQMESKVQDGPYAALARLLAVFVAEETRAWGVAPIAAAMAPSTPQTDDPPAACDGCGLATVFDPVTRGEP
ncbi:MAG: molecular chaperone TorD family protein [Pseudorhodoplanes sp.]|nr:molecular chaperone TorD family protein [Pseudorhodoplanes sp.]